MHAAADDTAFFAHDKRTAFTIDIAVQENIGCNISFAPYRRKFKKLRGNPAFCINHTLAVAKYAARQYDVLIRKNTAALHYAVNGYRTRRPDLHIVHAAMYNDVAPELNIAHIGVHIAGYLVYRQNINFIINFVNLTGNRCYIRNSVRITLKSSAAQRRKLSADTRANRRILYGISVHTLDRRMIQRNHLAFRYHFKQFDRITDGAVFIDSRLAIQLAFKHILKITIFSIHWNLACCNRNRTAISSALEHTNDRLLINPFFYSAGRQSVLNVL